MTGNSVTGNAVNGQPAGLAVRIAEAGHRAGTYAHTVSEVNELAVRIVEAGHRAGGGSATQ